MDKHTEDLLHDKAKIVFSGTDVEKDAFIAQLLRANMSMHYRQSQIEEKISMLVLFSIGIAAGMLVMWSITQLAA